MSYMEFINNDYREAIDIVCGMCRSDGGEVCDECWVRKTYDDVIETL